MIVPVHYVGKEHVRPGQRQNVARGGGLDCKYSLLRTILSFEKRKFCSEPMPALRNNAAHGSYPVVLPCPCVQDSRKRTPTPVYLSERTDRSVKRCATSSWCWTQAMRSFFLRTDRPFAATWGWCWTEVACFFPERTDRSLWRGGKTWSWFLGDVMWHCLFWTERPFHLMLKLMWRGMHFVPTEWPFDVKKVRNLRLMLKWCGIYLSEQTDISVQLEADVEAMWHLLLRMDRLFRVKRCATWR